jgi:DNA polymerase III subunit delta'
MLFADIPGLDEVKTLLIKSVKESHVAHAQMFDGQEGGAAMAIAMAFAGYVNCQNPTEIDACGICASCNKMSKLAHPDVTYIYPTAGGKKVLSENFINEFRTFVAENTYRSLSDWLEHIEIKQGNIPVEESRQIIQNLSLKSYEGGYKIVLVWMVECMGIAAANALLKILEEPPDKTLFLLVTNSRDKLLSTILSRTQRIAVRTLSDTELIDFLKSEQQIDVQRATQIAFLAEGSINKALEILGQKDQNQKDWFANWMRFCYAFDLGKLVPLADEFDALTKESQKGLLEYGLKIIREIYLECVGAEQLIKLEGSELVFVQKFSKVFKFENLDKITELISEAQYHIERNARAKITFLDLSLSISRFIK